MQGTEQAPVSAYDALCLYFPDPHAQQNTMSLLKAAGVEPSQSHPYWAATGGITYRDPDGRRVVFPRFIYGADEPVAGDSNVETYNACREDAIRQIYGRAFTALGLV